MDELPIPMDVAHGSVAIAEEILFKKYGTRPARLEVSKVDRIWMSLHFRDRPWSVDPGLEDDAWYIEDSDGHRVGSPGI